MHNIDEFLIVQGDTLDQPQILENDELKQFDVIMANPPYSIKRWSQAKFMNDPFGRNIWGTPPQGCADCIPSNQHQDDNGRLLWHALGAQTTALIHEHIHVSGINHDMEEMVLDADVIENLMNKKNPKEAERVVKILISRFKQGYSIDDGA